jgi:ABC-type lipoprotein release transport system permease subunit
MAMGARAETVQKLIVLDGMKLAALSTVLGLPLSLAALRLSTSILYGVRPYDLETFIVVPLLLLAVALAACWIPSRRASRRSDCCPEG